MEYIDTADLELMNRIYNIAYYYSNLFLGHSDEKYEILFQSESAALKTLVKKSINTYFDIVPLKNYLTYREFMAQWEESDLFKRILKGKKIFDKRPPLYNERPWYEFCEGELCFIDEFDINKESHSVQIGDYIWQMIATGLLCDIRGWFASYTVYEFDTYEFETHMRIIKTIPQTYLTADQKFPVPEVYERIVKENLK